MRYNKDSFVVFRTNSQQKGLLIKLASAKGMNVSELIRKLIRKKLRGVYGY